MQIVESGAKTFRTDSTYNSRETKPKYVYEKYQALLKGSVLDVGADGKYLKPFVERGGGEYLGIGFGDKVDLEIDLEAGSLPFEDRRFDTVLCLDVLEHLESAHFMFAELCRLSRKSVLIALPNPYNDFYSMLRGKDYSSSERMKFYGLPTERPVDRHRWFYSLSEAKAFLRANAGKAGFRIVHMEALGEERQLGGSGLKGQAARWLLRRLFRSDICELGLHQGTLWAVCERIQAGS